MSRIVKMEVYPVAGKDCMELNLSGAHAPYFTRNIVVLYDENGETGVGEVPGGDSALHDQASGASGDDRMGAGERLPRRHLHTKEN